MRNAARLRNPKRGAFARIRMIFASETKGCENKAVRRLQKRASFTSKNKSGPQIRPPRAAPALAVTPPV
jgi:hypothetical protein